jgi:O-antigen/teichoic acid export membrane protein
VASGVLQFVLVLLVTHGQSTGGAGVFLEAVALFTLLSNWGELGADTGVVRGIPRLLTLRRDFELTQLLAAALIPVCLIGIVFGVLVFVFSSSIANAFFDAQHRHSAREVVRILAVFVPFAPAATVALAATRGFKTMRPFVLIQNVALPAIRPALVLIPLVLGAGSAGITLAWAAPIVGVAVAAVVVLESYVRSTKADPTAVRARSFREIASEFWGFSGPRAAAAMLGTTITWLDVLLVGGLASTKAAAVYAAASRLSVLGTYALQAIGMAVAPEFSALLSRDASKEAERIYRISTWWTMTLFWPLYISFAIFAPLFMKMFGHHYAGGATPLLILSLAGLVNLGTGNSTILLLMSGESGWNLANAAVSLALNLGLNFALIPRYGASGAAIAWAVSIVVNNLAAVIEVAILLGIQPFGSGYTISGFGSIACFGIVGLAARWEFGDSLVAVATAVAVGGASYCLLLWKSRKALALDTFAAAMRRLPRPTVSPT